MRRHELDLISLGAGVLFLLVAVGHLIGALTDVRLDVDARWIAPVVLLAGGALGLLASLSRWGREDGSDRG